MVDDMTKVKVEMPGSAKKWFCPSCHDRGEETILAFVEGNIIRIKRKDLYCEFEGIGIIRVICYHCGFRAQVESSEYQNYLKFALKDGPGPSQAGQSPLPPTDGTGKGK